MRRREFLRIGGAGCLGLVAGSEAVASALLRPPAANAEYRAHDAIMSGDARRLRKGLATLVGSTVRVTVFGLAPAPSTVAERATLDVLFSSEGGDFRFHAWAIHETDRTGQPAAARFRVRVTERGISLEPSWNEQVFPVRLSVGREPGVAKLRFGEYRVSRCAGPGIVFAIDPGDHPGRMTSTWTRPQATVRG